MWWTVLIVVGFAISAAMKSIPTNPIEDVPMTYCPVGMTTCTSSHEEFNPDDVLVWHLEKLDSTYLLKVDLLKPLKSAFATVYLTGSSPLLIGQINEMRSYEFSIPNTVFLQSDNVQVQDELTKNIFDTKALKDLKQ